MKEKEGCEGDPSRLPHGLAPPLPLLGYALFMAMKQLRLCENSPTLEA